MKLIGKTAGTVASNTQAIEQEVQVKFTVKLDPDLSQAFSLWCVQNQQTKAQVLRNYIERLVKT